MFRKKSPKTIVQVKVVTQYQRTPEDIQREARITDYIKRAEDEYARIYDETGQQLDRRDAGEHYHQDTVTRQLGEMRAIADSLAIIKGSDLIIEVAQLDRKSEARRGEIFPYSSFLSSRSPIYPVAC